MGDSRSCTLQATHTAAAVSRRRRHANGNCRHHHRAGDSGSHSLARVSGQSVTNWTPVTGRRIRRCWKFHPSDHYWHPAIPTGVIEACLHDQFASLPATDCTRAHAPLNGRRIPAAAHAFVAQELPQIPRGGCQETLSGPSRARGPFVSRYRVSLPGTPYGRLRSYRESLMRLRRTDPAIGRGDAGVGAARSGHRPNVSRETAPARGAIWRPRCITHEG